MLILQNKKNLSVDYMDMKELEIGEITVCDNKNFIGTLIIKMNNNFWYSLSVNGMYWDSSLCYYKMKVRILNKGETLIVR